MDSRTELFAVTLNISAKGEPRASNPNTLHGLYRRYEDAQKECDFLLKYALTERYDADQFNGREKHTFHSTTDYRYDADGNEVEDKDKPRVDGLGGCDWDVYYTNRLESTVNDYHHGFSVVKWVDFEY